MKRIDYFICFTSEMPAKVIYDEKQVEILTFDFDAGDFVPGVISWATLYMSHDAIERVSEGEFEAYVAKLRELYRLDAPRYYIIDKRPVKAIPMDERLPEVRGFNLETDEFDIVRPYFNLVSCQHGEIGRLSREEFEHYVQEIRAWRDQLQVPKYFIVSGQPVKMVRAEDGKLKLLGYFDVTDSFIPSQRKWLSLIPPINPDWVREVAESEFQRCVEEARDRFQEQRQRDNPRP